MSAGDPLRPSSWTVGLSPQAQRAFDRLGSDAERERVLTAMERLQEDPYAGGVVKLQGRDEWRLRVGDRRLLLYLDLPRRRIVVTRIGNRGEIYRKGRR